jgi:hypothetical protein
VNPNNRKSYVGAITPDAHVVNYYDQFYLGNPLLRVNYTALHSNSKLTIEHAAQHCPQRLGDDDVVYIYDKDSHISEGDSWLVPPGVHCEWRVVFPSKRLKLKIKRLDLNPQTDKLTIITPMDNHLVFTGKRYEKVESGEGRGGGEHPRAHMCGCMLILCDSSSSFSPANL